MVFWCKIIELNRNGGFSSKLEGIQFPERIFHMHKSGPYMVTYFLCTQGIDSGTLRDGSFSVNSNCLGVRYGVTCGCVFNICRCSCQIDMNDIISSYIITESSKFRNQHAKHAHNHRKLSCWIGFGMFMEDHHGWSIIELNGSLPAIVYGYVSLLECISMYFSWFKGKIWYILILNSQERCSVYIMLNFDISN